MQVNHFAFNEDDWKALLMRCGEGDCLTVPCLKKILGDKLKDNPYNS